MTPEKSVGFDDISNFMIKRFSPGYIYRVFNKLFQQVIERISILQFFKSIGKKIAKQTRPISLQSTNAQTPRENDVPHKV